MSLFGLGRKTTLGIDIGTSSIKMIELAREGGRFKLQNYGMFTMQPDDVGTNGKIWNLATQDIAWAIKETMKRSHISAKSVVASLPSFSTFATVITMPYLSEKELAKTIPFEARKYIPIPMSEVVMDWSIIDVADKDNSPLRQGGKPPTVDIFMVAVPKEETLRYLNVMKQAGLYLKALEIENAALVRALVGNDLSPVAIVNIGGRSTSIVIIDKGYERVSHNYEVGGFEVTKAISKSLNVSFQRAEDLKRNFGLKTDSNNIIFSSISSLIDLMILETSKTIHNYEDLKKVKISKVLVVGGLGNMPQFLTYFGAKLGLPVSMANPLARVIYSPVLEPIRPEISSTFAISLGLAMRDN